MPEQCPYCHAPSTPFGFAGGWLEYECGFREDIGATKQLHTRPAECYRREGASLQVEVARLKVIVDKLNDDDFANRRPPCNDPGHDTRWCSRCNSMLDGIDWYRQELAKGED